MRQVTALLAIAGLLAFRVGGGAPESAAASSAATAPRVTLMVVGRSGAIRYAPRAVSAGRLLLRVGGGRTCAVAPGTALAALEAGRRSGGPSFYAKDTGACTRNQVDAGGLFVTRIGHDVNRGRDGWVYKVGHRAGSAAAADPLGPFGSGRRIATGSRVLWFYCRLDRNAHCQPAIEISIASRRVSAGTSLAVIVRSYDDLGRGRIVSGATVTLGPVTAITDAAGRATLAAPSDPGVATLRATKPGLVPAFPLGIAIR